MNSAHAGFPRGGVHPAEGKELSLGPEVVPVEAPAKVLVQVTQHLGKPSKVAVQKGDAVRVGQVLATADGPISAPVHSPVSGKVVKVADVPVVGALQGACIEIANDSKNEGAEEFARRPVIDWSASGTFLGRIRDAGIVGMGGAAFPTAVKLSPPGDARVDCLVLNGCECEPYLTADDTLMRSRPQDVLAGAVIMASILKVGRILVGIEENKPQAISALTAEALGRGYSFSFVGEAPTPEIVVVPLRTRYPQGAEKQLIDALLKRRVGSGKLPFSAGVVVQNVATAVAAYEAVALGKPLFERVVTVSGGAVNRPGNYRVKVGTTLSALVEAAGGTKENLKAMIAGGPMMGKSLRALDAPVTKAFSGLLLLDDREARSFVETDCIRCGRCVEACPMGLSPCEITALAEFSQWESAVGCGALDCVECGSCQYVCPARRHLVARIRLTKLFWRRMKK